MSSFVKVTFRCNDKEEKKIAEDKKLSYSFYFFTYIYLFI